MAKHVKAFCQNGEKITPALKDEIVIDYLPLIRFLVQNIVIYMPPPVEKNDLINAGIIGLLDALDKYNGAKGQLKSYAVIRIKGAILDELRNNDWLSRSARDKQNIFNQAYYLLEQRLGRQPNHEEIANILDISSEDLHKLKNESRDTTPIHFEDLQNDSNGNICDCPFDIIKNVNAPDPFVCLADKEKSLAIKAAVETLPPAEQAAICLYFYKNINQKDAGLILGFSESRMSQIINKAYRLLKKKINPQQYLE